MRAKKGWQLLHWAATSSLPLPSGSSWPAAGRTVTSSMAASESTRENVTRLMESSCASRGAGHLEKRAHHMPELLAGVTERDGVRGAGQDDELAVRIRQAAVELEQVLLRRDAVMLAAHH